MSLLPRWQSRIPSRGADAFSLDKFFEDIQEEFLAPHSSGLSVSSDEEHVYVEADVPGLVAKEVDVSIDNEGVLWIKGERKAEENHKEKKYYRKSHASFSYCVRLGDEIDETMEPQASCKNGVMKIIFAKKKERQKEAKKIAVKEEQ